MAAGQDSVAHRLLQAPAQQGCYPPAATKVTLSDAKPHSGMAAGQVGLWTHGRTLPEGNSSAGAGRSGGVDAGHCAHAANA